MYNVKDLIEKMKLTAGIKTNTDLSKELEVSYNTLNTWLKRKKLPQEVILNFATKYNISLDYLLQESNPLNNIENDSLFSSNTTIHSEQNTPTITSNNLKTFVFYGEYEPLTIKTGDMLELDAALLHSNGHYLLKYDNIYFIAKVTLNVYTNKATITTSESQNSIDISSFKDHNIGIITNIKNS